MQAKSITGGQVRDNEAHTVVVSLTFFLFLFFIVIFGFWFFVFFFLRHWTPGNSVIMHILSLHGVHSRM